MVISTSASSFSEQGRDTAKVSTDFGITPVLEMFSFGDGKAAVFEVSSFIEYGNWKYKKQIRII